MDLADLADLAGLHGLALTAAATGALALLKLLSEYFPRAFQMASSSFLADQFHATLRNSGFISFPM
jgi:hypothetical protein